MALKMKLYNTKSREIEEFKPIKKGVVTMYACGPTVYDFTHIGHMRKYIGDDILRRTLSYLDYEVKHVMNITDVGHLTNDSDEGDDKFEGKAKSEGKSVWDIATLYTDYFHESMEVVNVLPPNIAEAKATEHIKEMIALNETLVKKGFAYETDQALYFDVSKDQHYGKLSGQKLSEKIIGARDEVAQDAQKKTSRYQWRRCLKVFVLTSG
jgi:cysteinyl-tRNA synthetase